MYSRLYLHIPFCRRKCPYCAFVSRPDQTYPLERYVDLLLREMTLAHTASPNAEALDSIYFGGGTPSLLSPDQLARLLEQACRLFQIARGAEITLEANPGTVDRKLLTGFRDVGINRLSLGVQSFDNSQLATLGRIHGGNEARAAFAAARAAGFDNIGMDLIHALPGQTMAMWQGDLRQALALAPEHISVYGLTIEEGTPFAAQYPDDSMLPNEELSADMFEQADAMLTSAGYEHYEIANYALPGHRARHNSGYWNRDGYLGLGCGAHSFLRDNGQGTRFSNASGLEEYADTIKRGKLPRRDMIRLSSEDAMAEYVFLGLRMADGIDLVRFENEFGASYGDIYGKTVSELISCGLLEAYDTSVRLTRRGMLLSNQVFARFLP